MWAKRENQLAHTKYICVGRYPIYLQHHGLCLWCYSLGQDCSVDALCQYSFEPSVCLSPVVVCIISFILTCTFDTSRPAACVHLKTIVVGLIIAVCLKTIAVYFLKIIAVCWISPCNCWCAQTSWSRQPCQCLGWSHWSATCQPASCLPAPTSRHYLEILMSMSMTIIISFPP